MRVTGVEISSGNANVLNFSMDGISSNDKYLIKNIIGLDADDIHRKFYGFGSASNSKFYRYGVTKRELVIRAVLNPNYAINESYSEIRDELYRYISSNRTGEVNMLFTNGGAALASLDGYITKFEVPYFSKIPELQITIACDDPILRGVSPFEYESANLSTSNPVYVSDSLSTAPHGVTFSVEFTAYETHFLIQDVQTNPEWTFKVTPTAGFTYGDILTFSSEFGEKKLYVDQAGVITNLMDKIEPGSIWPIVFPGANEYYFEQMGSFDWVSLSYYPAYWGI